MNIHTSRRHFVASSLTAGAAMTFLSDRSLRAAQSPANKIVLAVAGVRAGAPGSSGRGIDGLFKTGKRATRVDHIVNVTPCAETLD